MLLSVRWDISYIVACQFKYTFKSDDDCLKMLAL